ncbi:isochorismatase [filamentous cyanobacterium LEGE 11480]|uniref:Isochorismatase n=1 Tax=Romeriopsis navalis LEGE 11480 TaxID=2777977 RepID=A0A928VQQ2_9CYAN|nr:isochorismatase [Romeriopsis navalis]MBE9033013.1 isochorismatase [Romeriopsis navalis LEGE 11480]
MQSSLPIPDFFAPEQVGAVWRVPYQSRSTEAIVWAKQHQIQPAVSDAKRVCLLAIDVQNTFCIPDFELFVGGASGRGAVDDTQRLCEFIYRNLGSITTIVPTMDTHTAMQIFHPVFWVDAAGNHPTPVATMITLEDVESGQWKVNPAIAASLTNGDYEQLQAHALHYTRQLTQDGKYPLTIWCYHSMLGGIGHALVSAFEEATFFHGMARGTQARFELKGDNPLTENYSVLRPEVMTGAMGQSIAEKNQPLIQTLLDYDAVVVAGQAKSHCVAWTIDDLLTEIQAVDPQLAQKVYLLEDCTSPVVVPGVVDFSEAADAGYARFAAAGMRIVQSTDLVGDWV